MAPTPGAQRANRRFRAIAWTITPIAATIGHVVNVASMRAIPSQNSNIHAMSRNRREWSHAMREPTVSDNSSFGSTLLGPALEVGENTELLAGITIYPLAAMASGALPNRTHYCLLVTDWSA